MLIEEATGKGRDLSPFAEFNSLVEALGCCLFSMNLSILSCNVRGLNKADKRAMVKEVIKFGKAEVALL